MLSRVQCLRAAFVATLAALVVVTMAIPDATVTRARGHGDARVESTVGSRTTAGSREAVERVAFSRGRLN